ncbi:hypothetical protein ACVBEH_05380 [Roseateles sp. GG27B]
MTTALSASKQRLRIGVDARSAIGQHARGEGKCLIQLYQEISKLRPDWQLLFFGTGPQTGGSRLQETIPSAEVHCFELPGFRWNSWKTSACLPRRHGIGLTYCTVSAVARPGWR